MKKLVVLYEVRSHRLGHENPGIRYFHDIEAAKDYIGDNSVGSVWQVVLEPTNTHESKPKLDNGTWSSTVTTIYRVVSRTPMQVDKTVLLREAT